MNQTHPAPTRDEQALQMALDGLDQSTIARRLGTTQPVVSQMLVRLTHRSQVLTYLFQHPNERFTAREIGQALGVEFGRVQYVIKTLAKRGGATYKEQNGDDSGGHRQMRDIRLTAIGMKEAAKVAGRTPMPSNGHVEHGPIPDSHPEPASEPLSFTPEGTLVERPTKPLDPAEWPVLDRLTRQAEAIEAAADALRDVEGLEAIASLLSETASSRSEVEAEYLRFARERSR